MAILLELPTAFDALALARAAASVLCEALAQGPRLHLPGERDRHRQRIEQAIALAHRALLAGSGAEAVAGARSTLVKAHAACARDARHGAGQLSLGAQRAPTSADCDDGWRRVEDIVAVAEASAEAAAGFAGALDEAEAWACAGAARIAAQEARRIVDRRNHAYTFHADPGFSFGEGWYLAAAAILDASVTIQIEPDRAQTAQVERFLRDVGLADRLLPYRSRPRANKHLPEIVARAFHADPGLAQAKLRARFLGDEDIPAPIMRWIDRRLVGAGLGENGNDTKTVLFWVRYGRHHPNRNSVHAELVELARRASAVGLVPVLVGDALRDGPPPLQAVDLTLFWKDPVFQGLDMRRAQLQFFEHLRRAHGLVGQIGVTTAGMDGPALLGLPTMYLTDAPNVRLGRWVGAVPGYQEIVRKADLGENAGAGYLNRISDTFRRWASRDGALRSS